MIRSLCVGALFALAGATPVAAQDVGPALDPGLMAGWTGGAAVQDDLEKRAGHANRADESTARAQANCARLPELRARFRGDPRLEKIASLCRRLGYAH